MKKALLIWLTAMLRPITGAAFDIDYARVFSEHAKGVQQIDEATRVLELSGPVVLTEKRQEDGGLRYYGVDNSGHGAVGCLLGIAFELSVSLNICPDLLEPIQMDKFRANTLAIAHSAGQNAVPPVAEGEIASRFDALVAQKAGEIPTIEEGICSRNNWDPAILHLINHIAGFEPEELDQMLNQPPRLPVVLPCL